MISEINLYFFLVVLNRYRSKYVAPPSLKEIVRFYCFFVIFFCYLMLMESEIKLSYFGKIYNFHVKYVLQKRIQEQTQSHLLLFSQHQLSRKWI